MTRNVNRARVTEMTGQDRHFSRCVITRPQYACKTFIEHQICALFLSITCSRSARVDSKAASHIYYPVHIYVNGLILGPTGESRPPGAKVLRCPAKSNGSDRKVQTEGQVSSGSTEGCSSDVLRDFLE